ncbi:unnamed protein product [Ceutorhynchus assimilis]|uniref:Uncharacterized protein n=1 Tax=Ceutorhynchus assimilis TaxID=467358 RepID=A0A9N9QDM7_9CUCU|nr:unnamed protein product [Ceutorhynchus assimilis]
MHNDQIYVLEMIVKKIDFLSPIRINDINALSVGFKFVQLINFDIDTRSFSPPEMDETGKSFLMNYGKTFLFVVKPSTLRQLLQSDPFIIQLHEGTRTLGLATVPWKKEFAEMVKYFETLGIVKSTTVEDTFELHNEKNEITAKIEIFLRMSCFGQNVQTVFQIRKAGTKFEYLFRQRNASKTFTVEKYADERNQPLVGPMFSAVIVDGMSNRDAVNYTENVSLTKIFERDNMTIKDSTYQRPEAAGEEGGIQLDFHDMEQMSICFRPSENKFFDFLHLISADVKTTRKKTEITLHRKQADRTESFLKSVGGDLKTHSNLVVLEKEEENEMCSSEISKQLCKNKFCPATKKFAEYGIGPLATGPGLGTLYGDIEPPVTYGLSHAYGSMCEYGPYGAFSRPKHEELPFEPLSPCVEDKMKENPTWHSPGCPLSTEK